MSSRARAVARVVARGILEPRLTLQALRERGVPYVLEHLVRSSPNRLEELVYGLSVRSAAETLPNLERLFCGVLAQVREEDEAHYFVRLTSGEAFLIRKIVPISDMRVLYETFVRRDYSEHPPLDGAIVVDVGANIGDTAVYYALRGARVVAFEPSAELFALAVRNAAMNGVQVEFHNFGVGCERGNFELAVGSCGASEMSMTMFPGIAAPRDRHLQQRIGVRIVPLSDVLALTGSVFLLKMDCEGCEYPALLGLDPETLRCVEHFFIEYHAAPEPLRRKLEESGFTVRMRERRFMLADRRAT